MKFAMLFPGQSSQNFYIVKKLYKNYSIIRKTFSRSSNYLGYNLWKKLKKKKKKKNSNYFNQIEIFTISISIYKLWKSYFHFHPDIMSGHSLGQYSALVCSKSIDFLDALKIISYRKKIMKKKIGRMYAIIGLKKKIIKKICKKYPKKNPVSIACINSKNQIVITGNKKNSKKASLKCKLNGAKYIIKLPIKTISHCPSMKYIKKKLFHKIKKIKFYKPKNLIIDSSTLQCTNNSFKIKNLLIDQLCKTIQWKKTVDLIISKKIKYFLEISSENNLTKLNKKNKNYIPLSIKKIFC
ncbi:MAG: acyltransferase domain-containing protein [Buchnera aphidicola (Periphyllus lyropictus)]|uniref:acyltransferase domain-containing protein n=1 Tax=Buchnera aphidicola TaxID=9 RepID=UPI001EB0C3B0|nr:acyltransferase domain-containing protein [Buchnera aphidicola]NIH16594.1 acyltransferase domain-containing protein [Buchnera aphidicola (Periphyllus lyropictus)]USS94484.1 acyltransferase domain-containing protein [Buchnera aphidicola (Periphyllus lyropictus)]